MLGDQGRRRNARAPGELYFVTSPRETGCSWPEVFSTSLPQRRYFSFANLFLLDLP
jgi:hypothetical protein